MVETLPPTAENARCCPIGELLHGLPHRVCSGVFNDRQVVSAITDDSRRVRKGSLFVAVEGERVDGHDYVEAAVAAGATAVLIESGREAAVAPCGSTPILSIGGGRALLGELAGRFYGRPADRLTAIGITGTNGKTTVSYLVEQVLRESGAAVGVIGTVNYRYRDRNGCLVVKSAPYTTPDPIILQQTLREMVDGGVTHLVMETSSHALRQGRLGPISFAVGLYTNMSQDHLDYHRSMASYFEAKTLLFQEHLRSGGAAVIYDPGPDAAEKHHWACRMIEKCREFGVSVIRCGKHPRAQVRLLSSRFEKQGLSIIFSDEKGVQRLLKSPLVGHFNSENLLLALAALTAVGLDPDRACESLSSATGAPGRMQRVRLPRSLSGRPLVLVDYAHTPDALSNVLETVRLLPHRRIVCVFGCGGDRDRSKRPLMGAIAATCSDIAVVTDDNPRTEDAGRIRREVIGGLESAGMSRRDESWLRDRSAVGRGFVEIPGRRGAIDAAASLAGEEDIVVIAGKGHEQYQLTGSGKVFFDDYLYAQQSLLRWDAPTLASATGGRLKAVGDRGLLGSIVIDSRQTGENDVFVALKGERFDGHDFVDKALENRVSCVIAARAGIRVPAGVGLVEVDDTLAALGDLARRRRQFLQELQAPVVVGITGSCGKTTVKEMTALIFQHQWPDLPELPADRVLKTTGNFNNLIGLPLSLLPAQVQHRGIVLEMGMNRPGEIARLTEIAEPDIGCITNIRGAHLEGLGSIEGVAEAKGELFATLPADAVQIVNLDDSLVVAQSRRHRRRTVSFAASREGLALKPDVWVDELTADERGCLSFELHLPEGSAPVSLQVSGLHNGANSCAAAAIAMSAGISLEAIVAGLEDFRTPANRMEQLQTPGGLNLINDSYNANPASMISALETLGSLPAGRKAAVIGDMLELGEESARLHREIGRRAGELTVDFLGVIGDFADSIAEGALAAGMDSEQIELLTDRQRALDWLHGLVGGGRLGPGDWVLVKASRGLALDNLVKELLRRC